MQAIQTQFLRKPKGRYRSVFRSVDAEKHFAGDPCGKCGGTLRYRSDRQKCVECCRKKLRQNYHKNAEDRRRKSAEYAKKNPEAARRAHLKRAFDITLEQFDSLLLKQGKLCAICRADDPGSNHRQWHVDHCHDTGTVRGILCAQCNVMIAMAREDGRILAAGIHYLAEDTDAAH